METKFTAREKVLILRGLKTRMVLAEPVPGYESLDFEEYGKLAEKFKAWMEETTDINELNNARAIKHRTPTKINKEDLK